MRTCKKWIAIALALVLCLCGAAVAETMDEKSIDCRIENGSYVIHIPVADNDDGWTVDGASEDTGVVTIAKALYDDDGFEVQFDAAGDGETTVSVWHYYNTIARDQVCTWDLTVKDGAVQDCTGGSYSCSPSEEELEPFVNGEWLEDETQFTRMSVIKNPESGWNVEIVSPVSHGAYVFKATVYYDCVQDAFIYFGGNYYDAPLEEDAELGDPADAAGFGCFQFETVNEDKLVLHWVNDKAPEGNVYFVRGEEETAMDVDNSRSSPQLEETGKLIEEMTVNYGAYGEEAEAQNDGLMMKLAALAPVTAGKWESILGLWASVRNDLRVNPGILPDGLPVTDELCLVALGFQLNPDGTMKDELVERLRVLKKCAEKYPNALIVCTGGGTAAENETATEAGKMAEWLIENGVDEKRIIVEDKSLTTAQNAIFTYDILTEKYPQVKQLAIVSSDYHIATGVLLFGAEATLRADKIGEEKMKVVSNAAYKAPEGELSSMFQAGALIELNGDVETAFEIYYDTYHIHDLPDIHVNSSGGD